MFTGFEDIRVPVADGEGFIATWVGGEGPPLLLMHGYPQSRTMWHRVAPHLAERFRLVIPDLRGYGQSWTPAPDDPVCARYSKRAMAEDQIEVMDYFGYDRFAVVGHDRGGRVAHRMATDYPERVSRVSVIDIVPTRTLFRGTDQAFATAYWHWFFLIQSGGLPERMIGADPAWFIREILERWAADVTDLDPAAVDEYVRRFTPEVIAASCADYRAAAGIDLEHDDADTDPPRGTPFQVLWGVHGAMERLYDVAETWRDVVDVVDAEAIDCGHFVAEERPDETVRALLRFLV